MVLIHVQSFVDIAGEPCENVIPDEKYVYVAPPPAPALFELPPVIKRM